MHTHEARIDKKNWTVIHNSDWSGEAIVYCEDKEVCRLPGRLFMFAAGIAASAKIIAAIEDVDFLE